MTGFVGAQTTVQLLGLGYRAISMPPASIGPVKEMVRSIDLGDVTQVVNDALDDLEPMQTLNEVLGDYTDEKGVAV